MSEFELKSLQYSLDHLKELGIIENDNQYDSLLEMYKSDTRDFNEIHKELYDMEVNHDLYQKKLEECINKDTKVKTDVDLEKEATVELKLDNITDFDKNGKSYIEIHYPQPIDEVRVIENTTDPHYTGKEIFESLKDKSGLVTMDGTSNATTIFEQELSKKCHEVNMKDIKEVSKAEEYNKLSKEEQKIVYGTLMTTINSLDLTIEQKSDLKKGPVEEIFKIVNKKIYISPEENVIISWNKNNYEKDEISTLDTKTNDNKVSYTLKPLNASGYKSTYSENNEMSNESDSNELGEETNSMSDEMVENEEKEIQDPNDLELQKGAVLTYKRKRQKPKDSAAFVNIIWPIILIIFLIGMLFGVTIFKTYY